MRARFTRERKATWVATLHSKKYRQARRNLRRVEGYCCLGVYCDLNKAEVGGVWVQEDDVYTFQTPTNRDRRGALPDSLGIAGSYEVPDGMHDPTVPFSILSEEQRSRLLPEFAAPEVKLSLLNDNGFTFEEIADLIERGLPAEEDE